MCNTSRKIVFLLSALVIYTSANAQYRGGGTSVFSFLDLPTSSRVMALGGHNVSVREGDIALALSNPALLGTKTDRQLNLNFCYYMQGTMYGSALYGHNFGRSPIEKGIASPDMPERPNYFAVGIHYLDHGSMPYADEQGNLTGGTFGARDILIDAMYARQLGKMFTVGVSLKPIISNYEAYTSFALGADVGGHFQTKDSTLQIGVSLQNIGWQLKGFYSEEGGQKRERLPLNLTVGISYRIPKAPIRLGMTIHNLQSPRLGYTYTNPYTPELKDEPEPTTIKPVDMVFRHTIFFLDIVPQSEKFYLTMSYNHRRRGEMNLTDQRSIAGLAFGAGVRINGYHAGFAMTQLTRANLSYQVSLALDIQTLIDNRSTRSERAEKPVLSEEEKAAEKERKAAERKARQEEISRRLAGLK